MSSSSSYLHEGYEEEEAVAITTKLLEEKGRYEREQRVLCRGNVVVLVLGRLMRRVHKHDSFFVFFLLMGRRCRRRRRWPILPGRISVLSSRSSDCDKNQPSNGQTLLRFAKMPKLLIEPIFRKCSFSLL